MEKINKMERSKHEQNIIRIVKGSLFAIILTFIFLFIFATILTYSCLLYTSDAADEL